MSHLFGSTLREAPSGTEAISHQLLLRAGFIRQLGQGLFSYLPLARRSLTKIENILREEIDAIGGQEVTMPVVHPAEIWKATGRWHTVGPEMARFKDRKERDMVLAMTHEEVVADLVKSEVRSYRQLPQLIYHIQTKFRDDPRPRAGLIRVREFTMKDSYSLDADEAGLDKQYRAHYQAYFNIFNRCGLPVIAVGADVGMMGGSDAHEFTYLTPVGEDTLVLCDHCGYAANRQIARFAKPAALAEELKPIEKVATPETKTIEALAQLLGVPTSKTAKAVFLIATREDAAGPHESFVFAVIRGDMEVNETKLANAIGATELRPATDDEIRAIGAAPGYASPINLPQGSEPTTSSKPLIVVDDAIQTSPNLVAGANEDGAHLLNTNFPRDYDATFVADIAAAGDGDACVNCGHALRTSRGVEVGNIFKLGARYTQALGATYLAADGTHKPVVMGSYGIGSGRLLACIAEEHHDDKGLIWPITVAPYHVHLVALAGKDVNVAQKADALYDELQRAGIEVLYDDRAESPGVKFADADLIGLPLRITVAAKSLEAGGVELKRRDSVKKEIVALDGVVTRVKNDTRRMADEVNK
jgi:prolyl-tRNA synthetase